MRRGLLVGLWTLLLLAGTAGVTRGAERAHGPGEREAAFPRGTWELDISAAYTDPIRFSRDEFLSGTVGVGYHLWDNFSLGLALTGYSVEQPGEDAGGAGVEAIARWHLLTLDRFTLYADGGGGVGYFDPQVPEGGTRWNYTARVGGGLTYQLDEGVYLMGGVRYFHLSNGNIHGRDDNPSYDGVQYYLGLMFTF